MRHMIVPLRLQSEARIEGERNFGADRLLMSPVAG